MHEHRIKWRLADLMKEKGDLRNKDLAIKTELHPVTISKLKQAEEMPERLERSTLEKLCEALKCEPGDLMWLNQPPEKHTEATESDKDSSQKESLRHKAEGTSREPTGRPEFNQTFDDAALDALHYELFVEAIAVDYCTEKLMQEFDELPQATRNKIAPLLSVINRTCKKQLAVLSSSEQPFSQLVRSSLLSVQDDQGETFSSETSEAYESWLSSENDIYDEVFVNELATANKLATR